MNDKDILDKIEAAAVKTVNFPALHNKGIAYHFESEEAMIRAVRDCIKEAEDSAWRDGYELAQNDRNFF